MIAAKTNHRLTAQEVKDAARGRWVEILTSVGFNPRWLDGSSQPCPKCKGTDRFRMIDEDAGAVYCNHCFHEKNGDGLAAIQWWTGWDFKKTLNHVANHLGIVAGDAQPRASAMPARKNANGSAGDAASPSLAGAPPAPTPAKKDAPPPRPPGETPRHRLAAQFKPVLKGQADIIEAFAASKPPITSAAILAAGGFPVIWPKYGDYGKTCLAFYARLPGAPPDSPSGCLLRQADGSEFPAYGGNPARKTHLLSDSKDGWIIPDGFEHVAKAEIVWRVEGLPDALALYTRLPPNHAVISSACGAKLSAGLRSELAFLAGKTVFIVGDADIPGQDGAAGFANDVVAVAARVKLGELPYQVEENHGRDIRDFFNDGHTFDELRAILEAADEFQPEGEHLVAASNVTTPGWRVTTPAPAAVTPSNKEVTILPPGTLVRAGDRNNIGTVITDDGGDTVEVEFVSKEGQHATKRLPRELLRFANGSSVTPNDFQLNLLTTDEFLASDFRQHFLIKKVLVEGQCCVLGGPKKVLKTSLLVDLAISLATATPFLGHPEFAVPDVVPVMLLSGESGGFTLKETAKRIALARGWILASAPIFWGFNLPQLSNGDHLEKLARQIKAHGIKVTIIDPAYLCLLSDGMSASATSNVFAMGPLLSGVSDVGRETGCTIIIAHHTRKADRQGPQFGVLDLEDLSGSGFSEWARQWILINRRELYQSDGKHTLWAAIGGSAGHSGTYVVDIDEGVLADDFSGRIWDVVVAKGADVIQRKQEAKERASQEKEAQQTKRIIEVLADANEPLAKTTIRDKANLNSKVLNLALDDLIKRGIVESAEYHDRKSRKQAGFKLSENRDSGIVDSRKSTIESFIRHQRGDDGGFCSPPLGGTIIHNLTVMPTSESQPKQTGGENPLSPNPPALDLADTEEF